MFDFALKFHRGLFLRMACCFSDGLGKGLAPIRLQAYAWTNVDQDYGLTRCIFFNEMYCYKNGPIDCRSAMVKV